MKENTSYATHTAHAKASFYAALNGYIELFSPTRSDMMGRSFSGRSAASWLEIAKDNATQIAGDEKQLLHVIDTVKTLVNQKKYQEARQIVLHGVQDADAEIRRIG